MAIITQQVICEDSLRNITVNGELEGYSLRIRPANYRSIVLSTITSIDLVIDGAVVDPDRIRLCLNDKEFMFSQLRDLYTEYWYILDEAELIVRQAGGLPEGEHTVECNLSFRAPYIVDPWEWNVDNGPHTYRIWTRRSGERKLVLRG
jgi:hypothetical protein